MGDSPATIQSRELGDELRRRREARGLTGTDMARILGWDQSKVSRMESGKLRFRERDVVAYLTVCRVTGAERERLLAMAAHANEPDLVQRLNRMNPKDSMAVLIRYEWEALRIVNYQPLLIPGLLQTAEYTRDLMRGKVAEETIEERVALRQERQRVLRGEYPTPGIFFIHENALRRPTRDPATMRDQLLHLVFMSSRPNVVVRVVPNAVGFDAPTDSFALMDLPGRRAVVCLDQGIICVFLEQREDTEHYRGEWKKLAELALGEAESRVFLAELAHGPLPPERTPDDLPAFYVAEE